MRKESDDEVEARATVEAEALPDNPVPRVAEVVPGVPGTQPLPAPAPGNRPLTVMMALPEPQRTREMEQAVQAGRPYTIRSTTGRVVRVRYGEHVLEVPPEGCQFMAPHAIHLLWSARGRVEEVG